MTKTLFIRNLPFSTTEADLRKAFEVFGRVQRCSIAKNRETGQSRGFGFVDMDDDAAVKAIAEMNGREFEHRSLIVQESDPKARAAPSSGPRPMGSAPGPRPMGGAPGPRSNDGSSGPPRPAGGGGPSRQFGPPSAPVSERRTYAEKKDRLKPYKRDSFSQKDVRDILEDDEE